MRIPLKILGQAGLKLSFPEVVIYVDPYLSNSVQELDSDDLKRMIPIVIDPNEVCDADFVIITHDHIDHCDPFTLPKISIASPNAKFIGPKNVIDLLQIWGVSSSRLIIAVEEWINLSSSLRLMAIPAAHPEIKRDDHGNLLAIGYLIDLCEKKIYISGDTFVRQEIIDILSNQRPIHTAFLPVNEHNYFLERRGIIGNMTIREAFQLASELNIKQVIPLHWDMFSINSVDPEEIRLVYKNTKQNFKLLLNPNWITLDNVSISVVVRTLNEERYLESLITSILSQALENKELEIIIVDSGSNDNTLMIAEQHGCHIVHIPREEFSFGRSLNLGCRHAKGDIIVIVSGHCIPVNNKWLHNICGPIIAGAADYVYGRQIAGNENYFSEHRIFAKYFDEETKVPQAGFYCNNANAALLRSSWEKYKFDESLTGLEDMELAKRLVLNSGKIAYVAEANVFHNHHESWRQIRLRFEREAIALQKIMPHVQVGLYDAVRYAISGIVKDILSSINSGFDPKLLDIIFYRINQYYGVYVGSRRNTELSRNEKDKYFFPL